MMVGDALPLCLELALGSVPSEERGYINSIRDYITEMKGEEENLDSVHVHQSSYKYRTKTTVFKS